MKKEIGAQHKVAGGKKENQPQKKHNKSRRDSKVKFRLCLPRVLGSYYER